MSPELLKLLSEADEPRFAQDSAELLRYIENAYVLMRKHLYPSPLKYSEWLSKVTGGNVWLKLENLNPNGSFKLRGALHAIEKLVAAQKEKRVKICAASAGNHAQGVAYASRALGCEAHIFLPSYTPAVKREATEKLGAKVYLAGEYFEDALQKTLEFAKREKAILVHPFNQFDVIVGQATCAFEALLQYEQISGKTMENLHHFICGIGGGGLAAGSAMVLNALCPQAKVIGVEHRDYNSAQRSLSEGKLLPASAQGGATIAEGIAVGMIGNLTFQYLKKYVEKVFLVGEEEIISAIRMLGQQEHVIAEGAGSVGIAALLQSPHLYKEKDIIVCVSGGNIDPHVFERIFAAR